MSRTTALLIAWLATLASALVYGPREHDHRRTETVVDTVVVVDTVAVPVYVEGDTVRMEVVTYDTQWVPYSWSCPQDTVSMFYADCWIQIGR